MLFLPAGRGDGSVFPLLTSHRGPEGVVEGLGKQYLKCRSENSPAFVGGVITILVGKFFLPQGALKSSASFNVRSSFLPLSVLLPGRRYSDTNQWWHRPWVLASGP